MIKITVPCSSANIGPGFDTLGIALNLFNIFEIEEIESGLIIEGCDNAFKNDKNLVYTSMLKCFQLTSYNPSGIKITMKCDIPIGSGLGSSSTCILAGILAANELSKNKLTKTELINLAVSIEGHGDNLCPALFGGLTCSLYKNQVFYKKFDLDLPLDFIALTPDFPLLTKDSRNVLPSKIPFNDSVSNIGATTMVLTSLISGDLNMFKEVCNDKLHEQFRTPFIKNFSEIKDISLKNNALSVYLSGAGPTIMVVSDKENSQIYNNLITFVNKLENKWTIRKLNIFNKGTIVEIK